MQGEHGTGRNVAPYVEMEWGTKAYQLMWELKELFDRDYVLNPGVILNNVWTCSVYTLILLDFQAVALYGLPLRSVLWGGSAGFIVNSVVAPSVALSCCGKPRCQHKQSLFGPEVVGTCAP